MSQWGYAGSSHTGHACILAHYSSRERRFAPTETILRGGGRCRPGAMACSKTPEGDFGLSIPTGGEPSLFAERFEVRIMACSSRWKTLLLHAEELTRKKNELPRN